MENLIVSANAVLPLMICIGVGYLAKLMKLGDDKFFIKCNSFCFKVFMSMMMFVNIYDADITTAFQPALIILLHPLLKRSHRDAVCFAKVSHL